MGSERRREDRLKVPGVSLWLKHKDGATICEVVNMSRLGIGLKIPDDKFLESFPSLHIETTLEASLKLGKAIIPIGLKVLRISGAQVGCSFVFHDNVSQQKIFESLSPRFVAQSLTPVAEKVLSSHLRYAYFGQDFLLIAHREPETYRLSSAGFDCLIDKNGIQVIDHEPVCENGFDKDFLDAYEHLPQGRLTQKEVIEWMLSVIDYWEEKPSDLSPVVKRMREHHAV